MSQLLLSDLTALASEAKRKSPEVRTASDAALAALRTNGDQLFNAKEEQAVAAGENVLLQPIILACEGKAATPKVVGIAVGLLQRVIGLRVIRDADCATLIRLLQHVVSTRADVEVHLKVLQAISSLLSSYACIHHTLLSDVLGLCFQLQDSRVSVVSSTASATLRQAVMTVFEKVRDEDKVLDGIKAGGEDAAAAAPLATMTIQLPASNSVTLFPCSRDTYLILSDLNALANNEQAPFLRLASLSRTFTLELIESILTNHAHLFRNDTHPELLLCLRQATCPLLIKAFNEQPSFPTTLRLMRLLFVLLRQFSGELIVEVEILITILLRFIAPPSASDARRTSSDRLSYEGMPTWQRVLAMEATRSLCSDGVLMRNLWKWFDGRPDSIRVFTQLIDTLRNLATENLALIGSADAAHQMSQTSSKSSKVGSPTNERPAGGRRSSSGLYNAAAGVASAAIGGFTSVTDLATGGGAAVGLSQTSVPTVQLIDQLDKSDAPNVPSTYIYLLALQSLVHLAQSLAAFVLPMYSRFVNNRPRSASRAPPSLDFGSLSEKDRAEAECARDMVQQSWAPLLDSFTFFMSSKCDDILFAEVLTALRNFTNTTGALGLASPRDALIASLSRFAIPRDVMAKISSLRSRPAASDDVDASLSERNAACLKAVTQIAYYLSGSIGTHWRDVLETLCDAEYILRRSSHRPKSIDGESTLASPIDAYKPRPSLASISALSTIPPGFSSAAAIDTTTGRPYALMQIDNFTLLADILRVFENTAALDDAALLSFIEALCELDADHIGLANSKSGAASPASALNRSSPLSSLGTVSMLNVQRITESPALEEGWRRITRHMLLVLASSTLRPSLRGQAASALDSFIQAALRSPSEEKASVVQRRSIDVLAEQSILKGERRLAADIDVRRAGIETFLSILETHGHVLQFGWESAFAVFNAACAPATSEDDRSAVPLIKVAFSAMQIICSNLLSKLGSTQLRQCVESLINFSLQDEEVNVALTAGGALWSITAELSSRAGAQEGNSAESSDLTEMWIHILVNVKKVTNDSRLQVRNGAISILFSMLEQYGAALSDDVWRTSIMDGVLLPLLEEFYLKANSTKTDEARKKEWDESRVLTLTSTGKVIRQAFIQKLLPANDVWDRLLACLKQDFLQGPSAVSQASMRALNHIVQVAVPGDKSEEVKSAWQAAWKIWCEIGAHLHSAQAAFTQANLVAYVDCLAPLYSMLGASLSVEQINVMLASLKHAMIYTNGSAERIMDKDRLTPLQSAIVTRITTLHMTLPMVCAQVLSDLAEYSTLAFVGRSDEEKSQGSATYIALNRTATEAMVALYEQRASEADVYREGTLQHIFAALSVPLKLRYDCPASTSAGAQAVWKGSMIALCKVASVLSGQLDGLDVDRETMDAIWTSMIGAFVAALTANCTPILDLEIEEQGVEEAFDLVLLSTIERDLWPQLGKEIVSSASIVQLANALASTSELNPSYDSGEGDVEAGVGGCMQHARSPTQALKSPNGVTSLPRIPRELFSYWCLELLTLLCSAPDKAIANEEAISLRRTAALCLPTLVKRIEQSLSSYVRDARILGATPLGRVRDEEINYLLAMLSTIKLWPGSLSLALSFVHEHGSRSQEELASRLHAFTNDQITPTDATFIASPSGLLFHLYRLLCDFLFVVVPRQGGRASTMQLATRGPARLYEPAQVPEGFELGRIGRPMSDTFPSSSTSSEGESTANRAQHATPTAGMNEDNAIAEEKADLVAAPPLLDPRLLTRDLLDTVGRAWQQQTPAE